MRQRLDLRYIRPEYPLDAPTLRYRRARESFWRVNDLVLDFAEYHRRRGMLAYKKKESDPWQPVGRDFRMFVPTEVALEVSELLYNLRVALDYVMYALFTQALADARVTAEDFEKRHTRISFPILQDERAFVAWRKDSSWIEPERVKLIEGVRPFEHPMLLLGPEYHYLDKHRDLPSLAADFDLTGGKVLPGPPWASDDERLKAEAAGTAGPTGWYVGAKVAVSFPDGSPLVETLETLLGRVDGLIEDLWPVLNERLPDK